MAIASIAAADVNQDIQDALTSANYEAGYSYSMEFNITSCTGTHTILTMTNISENTSAVLYSQVGAYLSFKVGSNEPVWQHASTSYNKETKTTTLTLNSPASTWFSSTVNADTDAIGGGEYALSNSTLTISYDATGEGMTEIKLTRGNGITNILQIKGYEAKASDLVFSNIGVSLTSSSVTAPVPEPATATLSLLALCGLAARRRRK